jgi:hypothetical protein
MSLIWLITYLALWVLTLLLTIAGAGLLHVFAALEDRIRRLEARDVEPLLIVDDGPVLGSRIVDVKAPVAADRRSVFRTGAGGRRSTLLVFMSQSCRSCRDVVAPLNDLTSRRGGRLRTAVFLRADSYGCRAFATAYDVRAEFVCDESAQWTKSFGVHHSPFALLYDDDGRLVAKGTVARAQDFDELLGGHNGSESRGETRTVHLKSEAEPHKEEQSRTG